MKRKIHWRKLVKVCASNWVNSGPVRNRRKENFKRLSQTFPLRWKKWQRSERVYSNIYRFLSISEWCSSLPKQGHITKKKDEIIKITWAWHGYEGNPVSSSEVAKYNVRLLELNPNPFVWSSLGTGYRHQPEPCRLVANAFPLCSNGFLRPRRGLAQCPALPWPPPPLWRLRPHLHPTLLGAQTSSSYPLLCLAAILISLLIKKKKLLPRYDDS